MVQKEVLVLVRKFVEDFSINYYWMDTIKFILINFRVTQNLTLVQFNYAPFSFSIVFLISPYTDSILKNRNISKKNVNKITNKKLI